jgi:hypothetical protein
VSLARQDIQHATPARHVLEPTVITVTAVGERDLPPAITGDDETQRRGVINRQAALKLINEMEGRAIAGRDLIRTVRQDGRSNTTYGTDD